MDLLRIDQHSFFLFKDFKVRVEDATSFTQLTCDEGSKIKSGRAVVDGKHIGGIKLQMSGNFFVLLDGPTLDFAHEFLRQSFQIIAEFKFIYSYLNNFDDRIELVLKDGTTNVSMLRVRYPDDVRHDGKYIHNFLHVILEKTQFHPDFIVDALVAYADE